MALLSVAPFASKSRLHKSLITFTRHGLNPPPTITIPTLAVRKTVTPSITAAMCSTAPLSDDDDDGVKRRLANHHSNLWDDDLIQSLSTAYQEPSYRERAETLIEKVREMFTEIEIEDGVSITPLNDLLSRLSMVDIIERLGIDRHFKIEIKSALDYVHSYWSEKGIGCGRESGDTDLNSTALGLRILRLHGYPDMSSSVLEHFKDEKGQFGTCSSERDEGEMRSILNLFRASLVAFPNEKVMEDAEAFCITYLKESLQKIRVSSLSREIEYVMEYGWHTNLPRLEARNYIDVFAQDNKMEFIDGEKLLELAKLEFNIFHSIQQRELKYISRWWKDSGFSQLTFARHRHVEFYTLASCFVVDPQHSAFRLIFAKMCHLVTVLDDIYDTFGTMDELQLFTAAVKRWDPSAIEWLPQYMKRVYMVLYETVHEMAQQRENSRDRDTINYARQALEAFIDSFMKEAEWISTGYLPAFEEYCNNGKVSFGYTIIQLQLTLTLDIPLPHHNLHEIDFPTRFSSLASGILRLKSDTRGYKAEKARGEVASCISCYMKENPGITEEDAVNHIHGMVNELIKELNWEFLKPDTNVPISAKKYAFDITRALLHGYKYRDGYSIATNEMKNLVMITVLEPLAL